VSERLSGKQIQVHNKDLNLWLIFPKGGERLAGSAITALPKRHGNWMWN